MSETAMLKYDIYDVILSPRIRDRPEFFLGKITPENLNIFIGGYRIAMMDLGYTETSTPHYLAFSDWVANKLGFFEPTAGWARIVLAKTLSENPDTVDWENFSRKATSEQLIDATRRSFELLEEFRATAK